MMPLAVGYQHFADGAPAREPRHGHLGLRARHLSKTSINLCQKVQRHPLTSPAVKC